MKKILNIFVFLLTAFVIGACSEDFLDTVKIGEQTEDSFFSNDDEIVKASNALYAPLWEYHYNWGRTTHNSSTTDDAVDREDLQYHDYSFNSTHFLFLYNYRYNYRGILIANKLLENVEGVDISGVVDKDLQKRVVAEAKFMRAYYYYDLVKRYGGVPLIKAPLKVGEFIVSRAKASEIYDFIESDLLAAAADLPLKSKMAESNELGRATKGAALAMLVKVSVSQASIGFSSQEFYDQSKWESAKKYALDLFALAEYSLYEGNYHDVFTEVGENGSGSIFEVQFYDSPLDDGAFTNNGNFTTFLNMPYFGGADPYGRNQATYDLFLAFEEGDPRREASIINTLAFADEWAGSGTVAEDLTSFYNFKHFLSKEQYFNLGNFRNSPVNERIIRLSDIYLLYAEAAFNTGDEATALMYVNKVRKRARGDGAVPADIATSGQDLLSDIYQERRVELCSEGHRWHDLVRTGMLEKELKEDGYYVKANILPLGGGGYAITPSKDTNGDEIPPFHADNLKPTHIYFPLPQSEIDNSNGVVVQNPGY